MRMMISASEMIRKYISCCGDAGTSARLLHLNLALDLDNVVSLDSGLTEIEN